MIATTSATDTDRVRHRALDLTRSGPLLERIRAEFVEMPGLTLTLPQAARFWTLTAPQANAALSELAEGGFLVRDPHGLYRRRGACARCS
ncbi:MAG TPA: hypothetical protein VFA59_24025 [Vicinamibacterales bacterium]|nr:hypothetical protein [Vicinamibacterales bacterium]